MSKLLTKLTCGGFDPESAAMPPGGGEKVTSQDVAAALSFAGVSAMACELGRAKVAGDPDARARVVSLLGGQVADALKAWAVRDKSGLAQRLTALLVEEYVDEPVCPKCKGARSRWIRKVWRDCPTCGAEGRIHLSDRERARRTGIPTETWRRNWAQRYVELAALLAEPERQVMAAMRQQFSPQNNSLGQAV